MKQKEAIQKGLYEAFVRMGKVILEKTGDFDSLNNIDYRSNFNICDTENPSFPAKRFSVCISIDELPVESIISSKPFTKDY